MIKKIFYQTSVFIRQLRHASVFYFFKFLIAFFKLFKKRKKTMKNYGPRLVVQTLGYKNDRLSEHKIFVKIGGECLQFYKNVCL